MIRVVLDTNVFVSAIISPKGIPAKILRAWQNDQFDVLISAPILNEIERVLSYPRIVKYHQWTEEHITRFLEDLAHVAIVTPGNLTLTVIEDDPSDNRYLECAVEGHAEYIVTGDQDLLTVKEYKSIHIFTPRTFITVLKKERN